MNPSLSKTTMCFRDTSIPKRPRVLDTSKSPLLGDALTPDRREWLIPKPLKRGEIYSWTVTAVVDGKEITSPGPSAPEMKFQILSADRLQQLNKIKETGSHLALGVFCSRVGIITEAEREFQTLVLKNPGSQSAIRLLKEIRSWRRR